MFGRLFWTAVVAATALAALAGCGSPAAKFRRYETYIRKVELAAGSELSGTNLASVDEVVTAMFGTPDAPAVPALDDVELASILDAAKLKLAAGPVGSDEQGNVRGLYREHCAHCHGVTGDGNGPTASFLNPYPRDYRPGKFKFKSTPVGFKPTHDDLKKIVLEGIPGTAMPSFKLLPDLEVEALVHYVKYLAIRGEAERELLGLCLANELKPEDRLVTLDSASPEQKTAQQDQLAAVKEKVALVAGKWIAAPANAIPIPPREVLTGDALVQSRHRGRNLFYGVIANCVKCHGDSALGDGTTTDYDDWAGEFIGKGPDQKDLIRLYVGIGLPEPRNIRPRNLRQGVYRGGLRPIDIYWRIKNGIEGTPMPAATMKPATDPNAKGLTPSDLWDIVNYVESLPYESISDPFQAEPVNMRERM